MISQHHHWLHRTNGSCDETTATKIHAGRYEHEEIASFCIKSALFGGDAGFSKAEGEWAQSEVGEGVEEVWARSVSLSDQSLVERNEDTRVRVVADHSGIRQGGTSPLWHLNVGAAGEQVKR